MDKGRRETAQKIVWVGASALVPTAELQNLIAEVKRVLHQPSSGPGEKELRHLEQKIRLYWQARNNVTIPPADLVVHVRA